MAKVEFAIEKFDEYMSDIKNDRAVTHLTQMPRLDAMLGGLRPRLILLAARPGSGKTTLVGQWADDIASSGTPALFYTLEMAPHHLVGKSLTRMCEGRFPIEQLVDGQYAEANTMRCASTAAYLNLIAGNIAYSSESVTPAEVMDDVDFVMSEKRLRPVVFIDYIQIMGANDLNDADERAVIKRNVFGMAKAVVSKGIPVIAISSINRTNYDRASVLESLGGSSALEYAADAVLFLSVAGKNAAEREQNSMKAVRPMELTVLKNRYGSCGILNLEFDTGKASFKEGGVS